MIIMDARLGDVQISLALVKRYAHALQDIIMMATLAIQHATMLYQDA